jgi:trehalose utilization protein
MCMCVVVVFRSHYNSYITRVQETKSRVWVVSYEYPLASSLDEFIQHQCDVCEDEAADVKAEELCGVAG